MLELTFNARIENAKLLRQALRDAVGLLRRWVSGRRNWRRFDVRRYVLVSVSQVVDRRDVTMFAHWRPVGVHRSRTT